LQSKAAKREKTGRFFLLFIVLACVGLLGWGASRVNNQDYAFKKSTNRTNADGTAKVASPSAFILSFVVGQVGGWVAWFFVWALWFKIKYGSLLCSFRFLFNVVHFSYFKLVISFQVLKSASR
jgi:hypothetical protein